MESARSAEICLGLVKPDSENDSVSFTPPFIHMFIDYKHCLYFDFTQKKPKPHLNPSREIKSVHFFVSINTLKNVVMFYFYLIGEEPPRQSSIFGQQNKLTIETM